MELALILVSALTLWALASTGVMLGRDGYRAQPVREERVVHPR